LGDGAAGVAIVFGGGGGTGDGTDDDNDDDDCGDWFSEGGCECCDNRLSTSSSDCLDDDGEFDLDCNPTGDLYASSPSLSDDL
jgi:hypothetical protein